MRKGIKSSMAAMAVMPSISATAQPSAYRGALPENSGTNMNLIRPEALRGSKMFVDANRIMPGVTAATPRISTGNLPTLEGHVLYSDANAEGQTMHPDAMYSFNADGTGFTKLSGDSKIYGSFGAVWLDGIYYQSSLMEYSGGTWVYSMANYDISTWKMIKYNTSVRPPSVASALVEVDELVYGCFFSGFVHHRRHNGFRPHDNGYEQELSGGSAFHTARNHGLHGNRRPWRDLWLWSVGRRLPH